MLLYPELSKDVIDAFYEVCRQLQVGYSENVYGKALSWELRQKGHKVEEQMPLKVYYKGIVEVGNFVPDLYVAQLINYLTTTNSKVGYVLNFGRHRYFHRCLGPSAFHDKC